MELMIVFDETGNRPQDIEGSGFGVGAIIFPPSLEQKLASISNDIGSLVGKGDFKYKHIQRDIKARRSFIDALKWLRPASSSLCLLFPWEFGSKIW